MLLMPVARQQRRPQPCLLAESHDCPLDFRLGDRAHDHSARLRDERIAVAGLRGQGLCVAIGSEILLETARSCAAIDIAVRLSLCRNVMVVCLAQGCVTF